MVYIVYLSILSHGLLPSIRKRTYKYRKNNHSWFDLVQLKKVGRVLIYKENRS